MHWNFIIIINNAQQGTASADHSFNRTLLHTFPGHFNRNMWFPELYGAETGQTNIINIIFSCTVWEDQCSLFPQIPYLGWQNGNLIWSLALLVQLPQSLCVLRCFSSHHCCKECSFSPTLISLIKKSAVSESQSLWHPMVPFWYLMRILTEALNSWSRYAPCCDTWLSDWIFVIKSRCISVSINHKRRFRKRF